MGQIMGQTVDPIMAVHSLIYGLRVVVILQSLVETGVGDKHAVGHGKLQQSLSIDIPVPHVRYANSIASFGRMTQGELRTASKYHSCLPSSVITGRHIKYIANTKSMC